MEQKDQNQKFTLCAIKGIQEMESCLDQSKLERSLLELVKLRTSQILDCDQCKPLRTREARTTGHTLQRLSALKTWRETSDFNERERAALAWTEALTSQPREIAVKAVYDNVRVHFEEQELVILAMAVNMVDSWNRVTLAVQSSDEISVFSEQE